jgi:DEAD/DEAH box helicase domain-containing protein
MSSIPELPAGSLGRLLSHWRYTEGIADNIVAWKKTPARPGSFRPIPDDLAPALKERLSEQGIETLYSHQEASWHLAQRGQNLVVSTGTASGKTLCYNLPVLQRLIEKPDSRALYLFPTKALAQDQFQGLQALIPAPAPSSEPLIAGIYDGDTPRSRRPALRDRARILLSNPDMLHLGILPYHTRWSQFFENLEFIVIDEVHIYRGVFGSHIANLLRRLKRIAAHYGAAPQFVTTSATIGNPVDLVQKLVEAPVELVDEDGSVRGPQHFLIYNPPVVDENLGIRRGVLDESVYLAGDLMTFRVQTLLFARSRRNVEISLTYLRDNAPPGTSQAQARETIRAYRSGYLPARRREIEAGLRSGQVQMVAATNALELGVDIGGMGAVLLAGFPGTFAATWQQAGRAGRTSEESAAVLVTSANPLDQFLAQNPEYFFQRPIEQALINPDNLLILLDHIRCAAYELPFQPGEGFGLVGGDTVRGFLDFLVENGLVHASQDKYFWMSDIYPAQTVSLRNASASRVMLQVTGEAGDVQVIGEVDGESATWMAHEGAIYLHEAETYLVENLDLEHGLAELHPIRTDYYTEPRSETEITLLDEQEQETIAGGSRHLGEIQVTSQIIGYRKIRWLSHERLSDEPLDMPPSHLQTTGFWLGINEDTVDALRGQGLWGSDPNAYGSDWPRIRDQVRARDLYTCQVCGRPEDGRRHDVHHKQPFRSFASPEVANQLENLVTLCPTCHRRAESVVRIRSGLGGLAFLLDHLAPLFLMCDRSDLGVHADPQSPLLEGGPAIVLYERIPAGIGFSQRLYEIYEALLSHAREVIEACPCQDGCPSCVGPGGELGTGGKAEAKAILNMLGSPTPD